MAVDGAIIVRWVVEAKKLRSSHTVLVSPSFDLPFSEPMSFKIMIAPTSGESLCKAGGRASIVLKCNVVVPSTSESTRIVRFSLAGAKAEELLHNHRKPIRHSFDHNGVCSLPKDQQEWDLLKAVDDATGTVTVCVELLPCAK